MFEQKDLREVYCDCLMELAGKDDRIVLLEADLMRASGTIPFMNAYPERTFNIGIAEANMVGIAAGLAVSGYIPFADTFTPFATRRCYDQLAISVAFAGLPVKICGLDPGVAAELNGATHMSFEDVGIIRNLPGFTVFEPVDSVQLKKSLPIIAHHDGPVYMRLFRKKPRKIYTEDYQFILGKPDVLIKGEDVVIFASGIMVAEALDAHILLLEEGISTTIVNVHTIKPLDVEFIIDITKNATAVVTVENHSVINGLGSAIAEVIAEYSLPPLVRVGVNDRFGKVGPLDYLKQELGLTKVDIVNAVKQSINK